MSDKTIDRALDGLNEARDAFHEAAHARTRDEREEALIRADRLFFDARTKLAWLSSRIDARAASVPGVTVLPADEEE